MRNILIVDAFSTGVNFIEDIIMRGYRPVVLWTRRSDDIFALMEGVRSPIEHRFREKAGFYVEADSYEETLALVKELDPKIVLPGADLGVELAIRLAEDLGLPGNSTSNIPQMTNKYLMHKALEDAGLRGIRGKIVHDREEMLEFYDREGMTGCVLKPYRGASSVDVRICDSREELIAAYDEVFSTGNYMGGEEEGMLLQERIAGTEYIVNTVSYDGRHKLSAVWKHSKKKVEGGGMVYNYTETLSRLETGCSGLIRYAFDVLDAVGVRYGNVHSEFMIDRDGPVLIEVNARPMGSDMPAQFLDRIWGHHETDLALDAYLHPDEFLKHADDPFRPLAKGIKKHLISDKERDFTAAPVLSLIRRQKSFCHARLGKAVSDHLARTVDLDTSAGVVYLANTDERQLIRDRDFLERAESLYFDMLFFGNGGKPREEEGSGSDIEGFLKKIHPVGSVVVYSDETDDLPDVTIVDSKSLSDAKEGYSHAILDIPHAKDKDLETMTETFFALADKLRVGGHIYVPESTYRNFPCGAESVEILCEAANIAIEAPDMDSTGVVVGRIV